MGFLDNLFNMADKREIKAFSKVADKIDAMEPKFEGDSNHYNFPSEPSLGGNQKQRDIPKIVPADLKKLPEDFKLPTASVRPGEPAPAAQPPQELLNFPHL